MESMLTLAQIIWKAVLISKSIVLTKAASMQKPRRKNMGAHRQQCPKESISCEYAKLGCKHVCLREAIADHNEKQMQAHLQLAMNELAILCTLLESRTGAPKGHVFKITNFSNSKRKGKNGTAHHSIPSLVATKCA